ncbi:MAG: TetR/AcrR family transcriptional regulator [Sphaerochaetaceae bacterium]|nr:TetR/AcrR family transcriptional regulator [Sphaerochaetaceae bacterium]
MPRIIDHASRKQNILKTALDVFAELGYRNTNLSIIASRCGISRTTIYQDFKDTSDIFYYAIKTTTDNMLEKYSTEEWQNISDPIEKLQAIASDTMAMADLHKDEIVNLVKALFDLDIDFQDMVHRRTAKIHLLLCRVVRDGVKSGILKKCSPKAEIDKLVILLETYCLQMAYFPDNLDSIKQIISSQLNSLRINN